MIAVNIHVLRLLSPGPGPNTLPADGTALRGREWVSNFVYFLGSCKLISNHSADYGLGMIWARSGQVPGMLGQDDRTGQDGTGQDRRTGQDRTGQDRTGRDGTGRDGAGQTRTDQDKTGQDRTGQDGT